MLFLDVLDIDDLEHHYPELISYFCLDLDSESVDVVVTDVLEKILVEGLDLFDDLKVSRALNTFETLGILEEVLGDRDRE